MSADPFRAAGAAAAGVHGVSGVERRPDTYQVGEGEDKAEEARLRKKFRGRTPHEVLEPINKDTFYDKNDQLLRRKLHSLITMNMQNVKRDPAGLFRDEANDIARLLRDEFVMNAFLKTLLWDLYVFRCAIGCKTWILC